MEVRDLPGLSCGINTAHAFRRGYTLWHPPRWGLEFLRFAALGYVQIKPGQLTWVAELPPYADTSLETILHAAFGPKKAIRLTAKQRPIGSFDYVERAAVLEPRDRQWQVVNLYRTHDRGWQVTRLFALPCAFITFCAFAVACDSHLWSAQQFGLFFIAICLATLTSNIAFGRRYRIASRGREVRRALKELRSLGEQACRAPYYSDALLPWIWLVHPHRIKYWLNFLAKPQWWGGPAETWQDDLWKFVKAMHNAFPVRTGPYN